MSKKKNAFKYRKERHNPSKSICVSCSKKTCITIVGFCKECWNSGGK